MDKQVFEQKDYAVGVTAPPFHPNCRTSTAPYFEDLGSTRAARGADGKTYQVPSDMTYKEWHKKYVEDNQEAEAKEEGIRRGKPTQEPQKADPVKIERNDKSEIPEIDLVPGNQVRTPDMKDAELIKPRRKDKTDYKLSENGTVMPTKDWKGQHKSIPQNAEPFDVIETKTKDQIDRTFYDENGKIQKQMHSGDHGRPDLHPFGEHGEHGHDYKWPEGQEKPARTIRDLSGEEQVQNKDILERSDRDDGE